jgi:anti-sigma regulatory factor (Ser/Thr protein kinase)/nucleoid DNA-binding protein
MNVLTQQHLAQKIANRASGEPDSAEGPLKVTLNLIRDKLAAGAGITFRSFADITPLGADGTPVSDKTFLIPSPEASAALVAKAECKETQADRFLDDFLHVLREGIIAGDKVELEGLFTLQVVGDSAQERTISFTPSPDLSTTLGQGVSLRFLPDAALRTQVRSRKSTGILLLVPERDFFVETIEFHFQRAGWKVDTFTSVPEALAKIESEKTAFLSLVDARVPGYLDFLERVKCNLNTSLVPILTIHSSSADPKKTDEFRVCSDQMILEPFEVKDLLDKGDTELARVAEEEAIFRQEVRMQFPTTDDNVNRANQVAAGLFEQSGLSDEGQVALSAAFREAVGNAAQHGNRHRRDKVIEVLYLLDDEKITANATDMGKGFDHRFFTNRGVGGDALGAARERHRQGKLGGLGIMLMLKCTDKLEYNEVGNSVTITKMLKGSAD